jgi:bla regulator protein blaR1
MIPNSLTAIWNAIAPALGNHLWQSTIFATAAAALTLAFRNNRAGTRYWLWLAASLKFLVPFSLLSAIGSYFATPHATAATRTVFYSAMEQFAQPLANQSSLTIAQPATTPSIHSVAQLLPVLLPIWLCGSLIVLFIWIARWHRISAVVRRATPLTEGPEREILTRLQQNAHHHVELVSSLTPTEPGIFGIFRPVLLWPESISQQLNADHIESIIAHELCHARRRDNLTAALHMLVESIFWFHPMVWWMGNRLVEDRERACDEHVVESGREPQVYAESILKVCEFCIESPLPCVTGVSGADLKHRIAEIMSRRAPRNLSFARKLLLVAALVAAVSAPILAGALHISQNAAPSQTQTATGPAYASVSITPNTSGSDRVGLMFMPGEFHSTNGSIQQIVRSAYHLEDDRIFGAPDWLSSERYDVVAKEEVAAVGPNGPIDIDAAQQGLMLRAMLGDRLKFAAHRETRTISVYALVVAPGGPKLKEAKPGEVYTDGPPGPDGVSRQGMFFYKGNLLGQGIGVDALIFHTSRNLKRTVIDETGLSGKYDFTLQNPPGTTLGIDNTPAPPESYELALSANLESQLGLRLEPRTLPLEVLVIDHVERPSPNHVANAPSIGANYNSVSVKLDQAGTDSLKTGQEIIRQRFQLLPGEFNGENNSLRELIRMTYGVKDYQIFGAPDWLSTDLYDINAKSPESLRDALRRLPEDQRNGESAEMLKQLLAEQFRLKMHDETKQLPSYSLVVSDAAKLAESHTACEAPSNGTHALPEPGKMPVICGELSTFMPGKINGTQARIADLASALSDITGRPVQDNTHLAGKYDIRLSWTPQYRTDAMPPLDRSEPNNPSLLNGIQSQLGLTLHPETSPVNLLVIDHVERPSQTTAHLQ